MIDRLSSWIPPMIFLVSAASGCGLGFESLTFDRSPDAGGTGGSGGQGGGASTGITTTTGGAGGGGTTSTSSTSSSSTGGSGGSGGSGGHTCPAPEQISDDFSNAGTLASWNLLSAVEGGATRHDILDIGVMTPGQLTMRPSPLDMNGWYGNLQGPFFYKQVTGNFLIAARVSAGVMEGPGTPPTHTFNTAGLLARKGGSGPANWVLIDVGHQDSTDEDINNVEVGVIAKSTFNGVTTRTAAHGSHQGWLGICRIGDTFGLVRKLDGELKPTILETVIRPDLWQTLQVGAIAGSWVADQRDVVGRFDSIHFSVPTTPLDCEACLLQ